MNLKEEVKALDLHAQIGDLKGVDKENKIVEIFRNVAQQILSGYFLVQKNQNLRTRPDRKSGTDRQHIQASERFFRIRILLNLLWHCYRQ